MHRRRRRQWPLFAAMAVLAAVAFPWYRQPGAVPDIWFGLPDWVVVAALCFLGVACLNATAWWRAEWTDESRFDDWTDESRFDDWTDESRFDDSNAESRKEPK